MNQKKFVSIMARHLTHSELHNVPKSVIVSFGNEYFELPIDRKKIKKFPIEDFKGRGKNLEGGVFCGVTY